MYSRIAFVSLVLGMALGALRTSPTVAPARRLRILVADDHPVIRKSVRQILDSHPRFEVCGEAQDGAAAIDEAHRLKPNVVVMNITMPVLNGIDAAREIKASLPELAIVILSTHADKHFIEQATKIALKRTVAELQQHSPTRNGRS
jgi:DNA-binding NarL/FixJ family response regulator